jgi:hypothetical protein
MDARRAIGHDADADENDPKRGAVPALSQERHRTGEAISQPNGRPVGQGEAAAASGLDSRAACAHAQPEGTPSLRTAKS